jgi:hypothetical protein
VRVKLPRYFRNSLVRLAKDDILAFLDDHGDRLIELFGEEMRLLDERVEEEKVFVNIYMEPLGREMLSAVLSTARRFLDEL